MVSSMGKSLISFLDRYMSLGELFSTISGDVILLSANKLAIFLLTPS